MIRKRVKVFFDGGCRPNPGPIEAAVMIRGVAHLFDDLGCGNSHDAEWLALSRGVGLVRPGALRKKWTAEVGLGLSIPADAATGGLRDDSLNCQASRATVFW